MTWNYPVGRCGGSGIDIVSAMRGHRSALHGKALWRTTYISVFVNTGGSGTPMHILYPTCTYTNQFHCEPIDHSSDDHTLSRSRDMDSTILILAHR
jgi:hypothetical protein